MAFKGITFAGQNVTPKNDGALYNAHYGDGILDGCSMTISGDDLVIASGHFIAGGRVCQVDGATSVDLSGRTLTTGYIQVIMNYDLSQGEGSQWYTTFVESATTTFPALTTDDINESGTLYQLELAVVQISGGNLTSIYSSVYGSRVVVTNKDGYGYAEVFEDNGGGGLSFKQPDGTSDGGMSTFWGSSTVVHNAHGAVILRPIGVSTQNGQTVAGEGWLSITNANNDGSFFINPDADGNVSLAQRDSGNNRINGISMFGSSGVKIYSENNASIEISPSGLSDTTKSFFVTTGGIQVNGTQSGGHPSWTGTGSTSSVSANTRTVLRTVSGLAQGKYLCYCYVGYSPSSASAIYPYAGIALNNSDQRYCSGYTASTGQKYICFAHEIEGSGNIQLVFTCQVAASVVPALVVIRCG